MVVMRKQKSRKRKIQKQNIGNAGEYYIAARLSALDFITTITLGRTEKYDILALSPKGKLFKISVKTRQEEKAKEFPLGIKDEKGKSKDFYYAFVKLNKFEEDPDFWIIPSQVVCPLIKKAHKRWSAAPGRNNRKHDKESSLRILPIVPTELQKQIYPKDWDKEVGRYYKNLDQLKIQK